MRKIVTCAALAVACSQIVGCGGDTPNPVKEAFAETSASLAQPASLLRFGGTDQGVQLYRLPALQPVPWRFETVSDQPQHVLGFDPSLVGVYFVDSSGVFTLLDLTTGRVRLLDSTVAQASLSQTSEVFLIRNDGALGYRTARRSSFWADSLSRVPQRMWPTTNQRFTALFDTDAGPAVALLSSEWDGTMRSIPNGPVTATPWGDLLMIATDSGLVTMDPVSGQEEFLRLRRDRITAVAATPSAHLILMATESAELLLVNRFDPTSVLARRTLPARVDEIRTDRLGRFVTLRPSGDEVWVVRVTDLNADDNSEIPVQRMRGSWNNDFPTTAADGTLLVREGNAVVAYDPETGSETGRVPDAPLGRWVTIPWDPQPPALQVAAQSTEPRVARGEGLVYYAQVSSTSNQAWAEDLAERLRAGGVDATVLHPTSIEDRYRVVLGPFGSRDQADDMGRRLGRAYFVFSQEDTTATR